MGSYLHSQNPLYVSDEDHYLGSKIRDLVVKTTLTRKISTSYLELRKYFKVNSKK